MYRVKRKKTGTTDGVTSTVEQYASKVLPDGKVVGWAADAGAAVEIDEALAARVRAEYKDRPAAGEVVVEDLRPPVAAAPAEKPAAKDDKKHKAE